MTTRIKNKDQDELATQFLPAVKSMAYKLGQRLPSSINVSDLVAIGAEELVKLARRYDNSINSSFWVYAKVRVNGAMLDYLRSLDPLSRSSRRLVKNIESEVSKYLNIHNEEPSDEYLSDALNEDISKIKKMRTAANSSTISIDEQCNVTDSYNVLEDIMQEELIAEIKNKLESLSEREQQVIQLYYFEELSLKEISSILNITESRISQIAKDVLKKIKANLHEYD